MRLFGCSSFHCMQLLEYSSLTVKIYKENIYLSLKIHGCGRPRVTTDVPLKKHNRHQSVVIFIFSGVHVADFLVSLVLLPWESFALFLLPPSVLLGLPFSIKSSSFLQVNSFLHLLHARNVSRVHNFPLILYSLSLFFFNPR